MIFKCLFVLFILGFVNAQYYSNYCREPYLENGRVRIRQRSQLARFTCGYRYTLVGNKYATCRNGRWDVPIPVCVRSGCPTIQVSTSMMVIPSHNSAWMVFFCYPKFEMVGSPVIYCDGSRWNDTVPKCVPDSSKQVPTSCDFEKDMCGWKNDELHDFDWERINNSTYKSVLQTGPKMDHTLGSNGTGYYMYIESNGFGDNDTARIISPVYDAAQSQDACFSFFYHMYGRGLDIGTLKVYQKPVYLSLNALQADMRSGRKQNYLLFDKSGYQGKDWYGSVTPLVRTLVDFQIIIEGVRGISLASNLAIDDVAILNGDKCAKALSAAPTPESEVLDSCMGRCDTNIGPHAECSCQILCIIDDNCCIDYLEVCEFNLANKDTDSTTNIISNVSATVIPPQTEKLVATPTTAATTTTSTTTVTTTTKRLTPRPFTTSPTTKVTKRTTTIRTTKARVATTKVIPRTTKVTTKLTTVTPVVTSRKPTTTTKPATTTKLVLKTTTVPRGTTLIDDDAEIVFKQELSSKTQAKSGPSGLKISLILMLVACVCCGAVWIGFALRSQSFMQKLRGRTRRDPEVRFLKSDVDDEE